MKKSFLFQQSYVSVKQMVEVGQITKIFAVAEAMRQRVEERQVYEPLKGYSVAILFYQPSTRTFSSFSAAARRLGAYVTAIHGMQSLSSVSKGESLEDTIRTICQTTAADVIVLRHPDDASSERAAAVAAVPVINAGSGVAEHPTQALLDLYAIYQHQKRLDRLQVAMVGDLLYGRTIKSLAALLGLYKKNSLSLVAPEALRAPTAWLGSLPKSMSVQEYDDWEGVLPEVDVLYMTRVQKEWFEQAGRLAEYEQMKHKYVLTRHLTEQMKPSAMVMHPLPRVGEILPEVDSDPRAYYFKQMRLGLYIRMALLEMIMKP
jgi:aspartate carbamoyltransferase